MRTLRRLLLQPGRRRVSTRCQVDLRGRSLTALFLLLGFIAGLAVAYTVLSHRHKSKYLAFAEYWVYLPGTELPAQTEVMTRMIQQNPYSRRGLSPIGPSEGLVFSDVRLHTALVLRTKNTHIFRPDLFEDHLNPSPDVLEALNSAQSLVKLRFTSDIPLKDKKHLQFLIHAADAVAAIGDGKASFDVKGERLFSRADLQAELSQNFDATVSSIHANVFWKPSVRGGIAETKGLCKIGISDLRTDMLEIDQQVIATTVLSEAVKRIWELGSLPPSVDVTTFDDTFKVQVDRVKDETASIRILRVQAI